MERAFLPLAVAETRTSFVVTSVRHLHVSRRRIYLYAAEKARWIADLSLCFSVIRKYILQFYISRLFFPVILEKKYLSYVMSPK